MGSGAIDSIPHFNFRIMARKKIVEEAVADVQTSPENTGGSPDADVQTSAPEEVKDIPDAVDKLLKCYPNYSALYIDSKGGVFPKGTQPNLVKDAILYQNPYYKS